MYVCNYKNISCIKVGTFTYDERHMRGVNYDKENSKIRNILLRWDELKRPVSPHLTSRLSFLLEKIAVSYLILPQISHEKYSHLMRLEAYTLCANIWHKDDWKMYNCYISIIFRHHLMDKYIPHKILEKKV